RIRSVVVVFPASICAMMPIFRIFSRDTKRGTTASFRYNARTMLRGHSQCPLPYTILIYETVRRRTKRATGGQAEQRLPTIVREGFICFCHTMRIFSLFHCTASVVIRFDQLCRQTPRHTSLTTCARTPHNPAHA